MKNTFMNKFGSQMDMEMRNQNLGLVGLGEGVAAGVSKMETWTWHLG